MVWFAAPRYRDLFPLREARVSRFSRLNIFWFVLLAIVLVIGILPRTHETESTEIGFPEFLSAVHEGKVEDVTFSGQEIEGHFKDGATFTAVGPVMHELTVYNTLVEYGVVPKYKEQADSSIWISGLFALIPILMLVAFVWFVRNVQGSNGRALQFGKSKAKLQTDGQRQVTFDDVAGIDECQEELQEIIEFLREPEKFSRLGGRIPKGVLLMGSPGAGKTLLARAVAGEAGVPFFTISGSDFVEMFVGVGASRVRDMFEQAKSQAPCIVFIDEIDAVGRHRGNGLSGGHDEREQTLNQLLVEMDGFEANEAIIVVAATNRPDVLDPALLRPGRFDRRIVVPKPDVRGRKQILEIHTRRSPLHPDVDLEAIARGTPGFSGADLENLCNEAALLAARNDKDQLDQDDFEAAREKIRMGPERRSMVMPEWERRDTAYHEAGHAIVAHLLPGHDPVHKVTIIPRGRALGLTLFVPDEDRMSHTRHALLFRIASAMGGRAAEAIALDTITSGAASDIEQATQIARTMVCELGMSDALGPVAYGERQGDPFLGRAGGRLQTYAEDTAQRIDAEVKAIVEHADHIARDILSSNVHVLHRVAQALIDKETLDREEFGALVEACGPVLPGKLGWMAP